MTADDVARLTRLAEDGRRLLGNITVLKERIAWLEAGESLYVAFDRGASNPGNLSTQRVPVDLPISSEQLLREMLLSVHRVRLAEMGLELAGMETH